LADPGQVLPAGKLPAALLESLLSRYESKDPRVIIGPRVGTDAAAIDMGHSILIVKSDPITFATDDSGWYLVNVNANDIACMGGEPRWLLVTALLPETSTTPALVTEIFDSIQRACDTLGITLVGGHTEITIGLDRPILIGSMLGEVQPGALIDPSMAMRGDAILLCKGVAIEGTALLARESSPAMRESLDTSLLDRATEFLNDPGISVVGVARSLVESGVRIRALHDPTEGGLATALRELSTAVNRDAEIDLQRILIYPETRALCDTLGLDPLGLIASGALLAVIDPEDIETATNRLADDGIPCAVIGYLGEAGSTVVARNGTASATLPDFAVDEIARFFSM
jgi:hydrogenase expression/formation protein HypE